MLCPLLFALLLDVASASDPPASWEDARRAESEGRLTDAATACTPIATLPGGEGRACTKLLERLTPLRAPDGTLRAAEVLATVRAQRRILEPGAARARVTKLFTSQDTPPTVRLDAAGWLAQDALERLDDPTLALETTRPFVDEVHETSDLRARRLLTLHSIALAQLGRFDEAHEAEAPLKVPSGITRLTPVEEIARDRRRHRGALVARGVAGSFVLATLVPAGRALIGRAARRPVLRGMLPITLAIATYALIAWAWDPAAAAPAIPLWIGLSAHHVLAAGSLSTVGDRFPRLLAPLRLWSAIASIAIAYLALYHTRTLPWIGL